MSLHTTSISRGRPSTQSERGVALVTSLLLIGLLRAIGVGLSLVSIVETWLGAGVRTSQSLSYAADAGVARVQADLASSSDWTSLLIAAAAGPPSPFNDRQPSPMLVDRSLVDLSAETGRIQAASDSLYGSSAVNPDAPVWRLFARGPLASLVPGVALDSPLYLAGWLADDPSDGDSDPNADNNGRVQIRAIAYGPGGARRSTTPPASGPSESSSPSSVWVPAC